MLSGFNFVRIIIMKIMNTLLIVTLLAACVAPQATAMSENLQELKTLRKERLKKDILTVLGSGVMTTLAAKYLKGFDTKTTLTIGASAGLWPLNFKQCTTNKELAEGGGFAGLALMLTYMYAEVFDRTSPSLEVKVFSATLGILIAQMYCRNKVSIDNKLDAIKNYGKKLIGYGNNVQSQNK